MEDLQKYIFEPGTSKENSTYFCFSQKKSLFDYWVQHYAMRCFKKKKRYGH